MSAREVVIGSERFWCPETVNDVVGVCDDLAIVSGHTHTFVFAMPGGEPVAVWERRGLHDTTAIARDGDHVIVDSRSARRRLELATGRVVAAGPPVAGAIVRVDGGRVVAVTGPGGARWQRAAPAVRWAGVAQDGGRVAIAGERGVEVIDVATGAIVHATDRVGRPTLSADGRWLIVSLLGPPRTWIVDLDAGVALTADDPPYVGSVVLGDGPLVVVDDAVWSLVGPRRIATVDGLRRGRAIRGDALIGVGVVERDGARASVLGRWRLADGARTAAAPLPVRTTWSLSVDRAGRFAACTLDASRGLLLDLRDGVWLADLERGTIDRIADAPGGAAVAIDPGGETIAVTHDGVVRIVDRAGEERRRFAVAADARLASFGPGGVLVVDGGDRADDGVEQDDEPAGGLEIIDAGGGRHRPGAGPWLGWCDGELVRRAGDVVLRVTIDGVVRARAPIDGDARTVWLGGDRLAMSRHDGRLVVRTIAWEPMPG